MTDTNPNPEPQIDDAPPVEVAAELQTPTESAQAAPGGLGAEESTVGTGTGMALGCIAGTVFLIVMGLIYLAVATFIL